MVFDTLRTRISSLWRGNSADDSGDDEESDPTDSADEQPADDSADETLSYAEQIEYGVDERDLPDEDKILRLLVKQGGRVDETTALEETGWSSERLEEVVSAMEEDDQVSAITVGRKRVICRRGFEPKGYRSHIE
ncbi:helix-turn-helix transcriptional regulator [Natrialbaceae archaeon GCM10025810]|uniref:helix-turn-helix transcriptional regulator n=1 Tax=Halovalidus salilacus TaxID=3075124 RepID=UPI003614F142